MEGVRWSVDRKRAWRHRPESPWRNFPRGGRGGGAAAATCCARMPPRESWREGVVRPAFEHHCSATAASQKLGLKAVMARRSGGEVEEEGSGRRGRKGREAAKITMAPQAEPRRPINGRGRDRGASCEPGRAKGARAAETAALRRVEYADRGPQNLKYLRWRSQPPQDPAYTNLFFCLLDLPCSPAAVVEPASSRGPRNLALTHC